MDDAEIGEVIARLAGDAGALAETLRRERDRRRAAGQDTAWLDQLLAELEPAAQDMHDLELVRAVRAVITRHGPGPYPVAALAALAGLTPAEAQRAIDHLSSAGLAGDEGPADGRNTPPSPPDEGS